jgi:hypothetical protein
MSKFKKIIKTHINYLKEVAQTIHREQSIKNNKPLASEYGTKSDKRLFLLKNDKFNPDRNHCN